MDVDFGGVEVGGELEDGCFVVVADGDEEGTLAQKLGEKFGEGISEDVVGGECAAEGNIQEARGVIAEKKLPHGEVDVEEVEV